MSDRERKNAKDAVFHFIEGFCWVDGKLTMEEGQGRKLQVSICETVIGRKCTITFRARPEEVETLAKFFGESEHDEIRVCFKDEPPDKGGRVGALLRFLKPSNEYLKTFRKHEGA